MMSRYSGFSGGRTVVSIVCSRNTSRRSSFPSIRAKLSYKNLSELLIQEMEIKDRTAKRYIAYMREQGILSQDTSGNYQKGERCRT